MANVQRDTSFKIDFWNKCFHKEHNHIKKQGISFVFFLFWPHSFNKYLLEVSYVCQALFLELGYSSKQDRYMLLLFQSLCSNKEGR